MSKHPPRDGRTGDLFRMLEDKLDLERKFGIEVVPTSRGDEAPTDSPSPLGGEGRGEGSNVSQSSPAEPVQTEEKAPVTRLPDDAPQAERLAALEAEMTDCQECELGATRTNLVFGTGSPDADIMFVGEAPGADEDAQGEPFVGRAGKLLDKIIAAMGLKRADVYIGNILKCRPPGNRNPKPMEVLRCLPYLREQIRFIEPKVIVCLGGIAAKTLLMSDLPVGRLRGTFHDYHGTPLLVTFHPAYLLRNPAGKADVWNDMKMVLHRLGLPIPEK